MKAGGAKACPCAESTQRGLPAGASLREHRMTRAVVQYRVQALHGCFSRRMPFGSPRCSFYQGDFRNSVFFPSPPHPATVGSSCHNMRYACSPCGTLGALRPAHKVSCHKTALSYTVPVLSVLSHAYYVGAALHSPAEGADRAGSGEVYGAHRRAGGRQEGEG